MPDYLDKLLILTQFLATKPTLAQLVTFISLHHCPSGELSSVYFAKIKNDKSLFVEAAHGFQEDAFVQTGVEFALESTRPSGRSIIENQILFDEVNEEYDIKYPAYPGNITYPWRTKVSMPINSNYFLQISRYVPFGDQDIPFYKNIQSLMQIYFGGIGKVSKSIGDLGGKPLTSRQNDILKHMQDGKTNDEIAKLIGFSASLVKQESMLIFSKLGISGRKEINPK